MRTVKKLAIWSKDVPPSRVVAVAGGCGQAMVLAEPTDNVRLMGPLYASHEPFIVALEPLYAQAHRDGVLEMSAHFGVDAQYKRCLYAIRIFN
jgi:hypothetical protein